mgnify:CR=1 FL=1
MRKILVIIGLILFVWLVTKCGDTNIYNYGNPDVVAKNDAAEDNTSYADNTVEPDSYTPPLKDVEEWAEGCYQPWPDGTWVECLFNALDTDGQYKDIQIGPCLISWDKKNCTLWISPDDGSCYGIGGLSNTFIANHCTPVDDPPEEETDTEEWACNHYWPDGTPYWPDGTGLTCVNETYNIDYCVLKWDKSSCTASCWNPEWSHNSFENVQAETVFAPPPDGYGCKVVH